MSPSQLEDLYGRVLLVRLCEQQIMKEYFHNEMKTPVHLSVGAEAIATGVHFACPSNTQYFGTYRNHALFLACTQDTDAFFGELHGKINGCGKGKAGSMHLSAPEQGLIATSAVVATTIPVAAGAALTAQYTNSSQLVVVMFGDGAVEEGVFFETVNFASLKKLPLLFVCEDNGLAIHTPKHERKGFQSFADMAKTFELEYAEGDGTEATDVFAKTSDVIARMKASGQPGFLHFNYFRFLEHVGPLEDFDKGYRSKPLDLSEKWDPLPKLQQACLKAGVARGRLEQIEKLHLAKIADSVKKAKAAIYPPPQELFTDVFAPDTTGAH